MSQLTREHWEELRSQKVAFTHWPDDLFELLLNKVFGPQKAGAATTTKLDEDALMIFLAKAEAQAGAGKSPALTEPVAASVGGMPTYAAGPGEPSGGPG